MRRFVLATVVFGSVLAPALAQQPRPTAAQILAGQLAQVVAQNAELVERNGQLEDRIAILTKQLGERHGDIDAKGRPQASPEPLSK